MLAACAARDAPAPVLFDCAGEGERYRLHGVEGGLTLEIAEARKSPIGVSTWRLHWTEMRTGYVVGQQGGHQSHLRLSDGEQHLILYEGANGELSDSPGTSYAGVVLVEGSGGEPVVLARCKADAINRALLENIGRMRKEAGLPDVAAEESGGPFDGWL